MFSLLDSNTNISSKKGFCLLELRNSESCSGLLLGHYVGRCLRRLLCIMEYISVFIFVLSFWHHKNQFLELVNLSTTKEYFIGFLMESSNHFIHSYHSYRYHALYSGDKLHGMMMFHNMLDGFFIFVDDLPPRSLVTDHRGFCNIGDFPEVLKRVNTGAMPDSGHSMIILSITTFFWGIYIALLVGIFLLEKRLSKAIVIQKALEKLISSPQVLPMNQIIQFLRKMSDKSYFRGKLEDLLPGDLLREMMPTSCLFLLALCVEMFLVSLFGVYAFKNAKIGMDSILVCVWEVMKLSSLSILGFYMNINHVREDTYERRLM